MLESMKDIITQARESKEAWSFLRCASTATKNEFLRHLESCLRASVLDILEANRKDLAEHVDSTPAMRKRLELTESSINAIADGVRDIGLLQDPVGTVVRSWTRPDGLRIDRVRTPIGVILFIFESRPNVVIDVAALCVKSGNAVLLRPGKEALHSCVAFLRCIRDALSQAGLPENSVQLIEDRRHEAVNELVQLDAYIDLVIPRGRESLIKAVCDHSRVPVIKHMRGLCHAYIDAAADPQKAISIAINAKTSNPATCNSVETILVHEAASDTVMPMLLASLREKGVEIRGCPKTRAYVPECVAATEQDWDTEYLDLIVSIKIVSSLDEALEHIAHHSSGLTDSIITEDKEAAEAFVHKVDSATVLVNASNRLTDGGQFGLGAEVGISTARIHMRGPMGLEDLTVPAYRVIGTGHIRH
ncbi:glutamate-5-semialdehyde dehydrogenase [Candidatus Uhrbacteria bacterium]|nr:glutamate-5-semialdehyde dehydrogenase [Candidatus Uhrbacteria bacterium]